MMARYADFHECQRSYHRVLIFYLFAYTADYDIDRPIRFAPMI